MSFFYPCSQSPVLILQQNTAYNTKRCRVGGGGLQDSEWLGGESQGGLWCRYKIPAHWQHKCVLKNYSTINVLKVAGLILHFWRLKLKHRLRQPCSSVTYLFLDFLESSKLKKHLELRKNVFSLLPFRYFNQKHQWALNLRTIKFSLRNMCLGRTVNISELPMSNTNTRITESRVKIYTGLCFVFIWSNEINTLHQIRGVLFLLKDLNTAFVF